jgi:hypothetical protein
MLRSLVSSRNFNKIQLLIVSGVLLVSIYLAISAARAYTADSLLLNPVVLLLIAVSVTLLLVAHPALGLVLLLCSSVIALTNNPTLTVYITPSVVLTSLLLLLWLLDRAIVRRKFDLSLTRPFLPLLLLVIAAVISFGVGQLRWFAFARPAPLSAQLAGLAIFILAAGVFFLAAHQISEMIWLKRLTWIFLGLCAVYVLIRLLPGNQAALTWRLFTKAVATSIFWIWMIAIAFSQGLFNKELNVRWRILLVGMTLAALIVAVIISYDWKSGWIPPIVALLVILYLRSPRLGIAVAIGVGIFILARDLPSKLIQDDEYSYITRLAAWEVVLGKIYTVSPIFGLGPANYRLFTPLFSILGYNIMFSSHNNYIDILAQLGFVGLAAFLWFIYEIFRLGWGLLTRAPEGFPKAYVVGAIGGLVATVFSGLLGDWIIPYVYNIGISGFQGSLLAWFFLGGLVALDRILTTEGNR